ncbi:hypothetical protein [Terrarubrum flagellatum]|uniref:hypothetical protein n=1 Tax=Terrirubrum flagellatum TaxID=2895980 RepID=UPI0031455F74
MNYPNAEPTDTQAEFARRLRVSRQRVNAMVSAGLPVGKNGRIEVAAGLRWIKANVEQRRGGANPPQQDDDDGGMDLTEARRIKIIVDTELARVQLAKERRDLVDRRAVEKGLREFARIARDKLLNVPDRHGLQLAAASAGEPKALMAALDKVLRDTLTEISGMRPPAILAETTNRADRRSEENGLSQ